MKPFDLQEALNGAPVKLQDGTKAFVLRKLNTKSEECLIGYYIDQYGWHYQLSWRENGRSELDQIDDANIVGMWEEPELTPEQVLEKAYNEDLLVLCDGNPDLPLKIIAKTKDGEFVMQPEDDTIQPWLANLTMEWFFAKDLDPKFGTITNTIALPKPFKPDIGDEFFYLSVGTVQYCSFYSDINADLMRGGQCFREREDAQKWLDFMKSMME